MTLLNQSLSYDDVLLRPKFFPGNSRDDVNLSVKLKDFIFKHPIVPANMKSVASYSLLANQLNSGGLALLHRFDSIEKQIELFKQLTANCHIYKTHLGVSVGVKEEDKKNFKKLYEFGARIVCIDIAHGHSQGMFDMLQFLRSNFKELFIIAGNVATSLAAMDLWDHGADMVKVGVGPGSSCSTRIQTGCGVPQLSALKEVADWRNRYTKNKYIMADGGIKEAGDNVKALCYADMSMVGMLFAGCESAPGNEVTVDGVVYKAYEGSSTYKHKNVEGVKGLVPVNGTFQAVLNNMLDGLRSGCSYCGVVSVRDLQASHEFVQITHAGLTESKPHNILLK